MSSLANNIDNVKFLIISLLKKTGLNFKIITSNMRIFFFIEILLVPTVKALNLAYFEKYKPVSIVSKVI